MKHTALTPKCGGCGSPSCPSCNPDAFLAKADVYTMELVEKPQITATPTLWRITPIRTRISKVISDWLNGYGVDAKAEDLNWKDLEDRLTDCFAQSLKEAIADAIEKAVDEDRKERSREDLHSMLAELANLEDMQAKIARLQKLLGEALAVCKAVRDANAGNSVRELSSQMRNLQAFLSKPEIKELQ